jgi:hypothetical protein
MLLRKAHQATPETGTFRSAVDPRSGRQALQAAIYRYFDGHDTDPKPFVWTADPNRIIAAVKRGHQVLDFVQ